MRLVVCLVFLASFAMVCQGHSSGYTRPLPKPSRPIFIRPIGCDVCYGIPSSTARLCCFRYGDCCHLG
uniref:Antimicrobial peptide PEN4-1 n=1 Tax=Penaeus schmitti TaxID=122378 RepID=Q56H80_PENSC|nr:antimicrobial peptide PEN4-1 [Penaeus schmitti]